MRGTIEPPRSKSIIQQVPVARIQAAHQRTQPNAENKRVKEIIILGGPNGAGKTTTAQTLLPAELELLEFVNADEIARGLTPFNAEGTAVAAGRLIIERMHALVREGRSFAFETTGASRTHANILKRCKANGWRVSLLYLWLKSPQAALDRVARRVREGGHAVPSEIVVRRYGRGLANMRRIYLELADIAAIYENPDEGRVFRAIPSATFPPKLFHGVDEERIEPESAMDALRAFEKLAESFRVAASNMRNQVA